MHKKSTELETPMRNPRTGGANKFPAPDPGGDLGVGVDFSSQPTEKVSGHNVYQAPEGEYSGKGEKSKIDSPMKQIKPVKVDE